MPEVFLAVEDDLSEAVAKKLLLRVAPEFAIRLSFRRQGNQYLKGRIQEFNNIARSIAPVLVLTDLDEHPCPPALIAAWAGKQPIHPDLLLRIAVRETEAWLLADRESFAEYTGIPPSKITESPEALHDPKETLLKLVRRHCKHRELKADLLPARGAAAKVGLGYNPALCRYVGERWSPHAASLHAPSLMRAQQRIRELAARLR